MCKCNTVTRDDIPFAIWSGLRPDTPHQCVRAQCGFRFSSASSPTRSLTFGRWGCGERCHLSHVVGDSAVVLSGISRQIALQTRSEALRRTKRGLNARQGMEGAKNAYRAFQEVRRADTPSQGLSGRQEPRQPPAKPICTVQAATRLVGGRRPSVLQRWGSGVLPRRFPVALKALPEPWQGTGRKMSAFQGPRANVGQGTVKKRAQIPCSAILIQYAREFEVGERAMQDRQPTRNCMQCSVDCPPAAGSLNPAALNDTKAVFECLFVVGYGAFPTKLFIQPVCF